MATETFVLNTREEVIRFEELLDKYATARAQFPLKHISLISAYECLHTHTEGGEFFQLCWIYRSIFCFSILTQTPLEARGISCSRRAS